MFARIITVVCAIAFVWLMTPAPAGAVALDDAICIRMAELFDLDTANYRFELVSNRLKSTEVDLEDLSLTPMTQKQPLGLYSVKVSVMKDGRMVESDQVRLRIRKFREVLVSLDRIGRGDELSFDKVALRRMDVTDLHELPLLSVAELEGLRARRNLRRGSILTSGDVEPVPDVEVGRDVTIVYDDGLCRVTAEGTALQAGMAGEYVKVKNKGSRKIVIARVVDQTAVAIDP